MISVNLNFSTNFVVSFRLVFPKFHALIKTSYDFKINNLVPFFEICTDILPFRIPYSTLLKPGQIIVILIKITFRAVIEQNYF